MMTIQINFKKYVKNCPHRKTYIEEDVLNMNNEPYSVNTVIGCKHEKVCKMYIEGYGPIITDALDY